MIYFIADVHIGNHRRFGGEMDAGVNQRCGEGLNVLFDACDRARDGVLVVLGDLFDSPRPSPQIVARVMDALAIPKRVVLLVGNHDRVSDAPDDHALAPLARLPNAVLMERVGITHVDSGVELMCVPHLPGQTADSIEAALLGLCSIPAQAGVRVACLHTGIKDAQTPPWLADSSAALSAPRLTKLANAHGLPLVIAGDWHDHRRYLTDCGEVIQCGALVPTGWDNPGLAGYGTVVSFDARSLGIGVATLPGPRFIKGTVADVVRAQASPLARPLRAALVAADADEAVTAAGLPSVVEVIRADVDVRAQAQQASRAARSADTLDEALARYVREMALPDDVAGTEVIERVSGYLARAGGSNEG